MRTFASDNYSTVDPVVMQYLQTINQTGHAGSYGEDAVTAEAKKLFEKAFGKKCDVLFVPTGTSANILGLRLLTQRPYEALLCSSISHIFEAETGALAAHVGVQTFPLGHKNGKVQLKTVEKEVELRRSLGFHSSLPKILSIANTTEYGTCYTPEEVKELADYCHTNGMYLHMDGCRLPNAVAALNTTLKEFAEVGIDVLSFGSSKNGLMNAEAVVVFNAPQSDFLRMQKQAMQLTSKMRYCAGQFVPYFTDNLWLKNAQHANNVAQQLAAGLHDVLAEQMKLTQPLTTNQLFCILPTTVTAKLRRAGHKFYDWNSPGEIRLVTSWDNTTKDVEDFLAIIK